MCEPATILLGVATAVKIGGAIAGHEAEKKQYNANKKSANAAAALSRTDLTIRQGQEQAATADTLEEGKRQTLQSESLTQASAAEAGVAGMSVDLLLGDQERNAGQFRQAAQTNLDNTLTQYEREKAGVSADAQSRINSVAKPSTVTTGLQLSGYGLDMANDLRIRRPK